MQYLLLCCFDEKRWDALAPSQRETIMQEYGELLRSLDRRGCHVASAQLAPSAAASTVRGRGGRPVVTDGPFAETKEQLGGYHLIECNDLDEAIAIAGRVPTIPFGGAVEVRPVVPAQAVHGDAAQIREGAR
jgi:hypothetical protein